MDAKKISEINKAAVDTISGGVADQTAQQNIKLEDNERAVVMKDLLRGLSFGPAAPECTDVKR